MANLTRYINIRQEVHLNLDNPITRAGFTTTTFDIERETSLLITANLGLIGLSKKIANIVEDACVGCRVGTWSTPDWTLININQTLDILDSSHRFMFPRFLTVSINLFLENTVNQS